MSAKILIKFAAKLTLVAITAVSLANSLPVGARADDGIDLEIDASASAPWEIIQAVPGDSGTKTIELHNADSLDGFVYIWISDVINGEGINPESETGDLSAPGELGNYLLLSFVSNNLTTNVSQPAVIASFPYTVPPDNPYFMKMPLDAGATITGDWQWSFYDNGMSQSDAQGDSLSFRINYYLTEPLPKDFTPIVTQGGGGGGSGSLPFEIDISGVTTEAKMDTSEKLIKPVIASGPDGKNILEFEGGTKITSANGYHPYRLMLQVESDPPLPPQGMQIIGNAYDLIGYTADLRVSDMTFDPPAKLTLACETALLLKEAIGQPYLAFCEDNATWQIIENLNIGDNQVSGLIDRTATFAVLAKKKPQGQSTTTRPASTTSVSTTTTAITTETTTTVTTGTVSPAPSEPGIPTTTFSSPSGTTPTVSTTVKQAGPGLDREDLKPLWRQISLSISLTGVTAMSVLALLERRRRLHKMTTSAGRGKIDKPG